MKDNLNALAVKVGELQARILRLDAFGERLAQGGAASSARNSASTRSPARGGPALVAARARPDRSTEFNQLLAEISQRARRPQRQARRARFAADGRSPRAQDRFPTTMPVPMGYYSSNYGYRLDPINGKLRRFHTGVDLHRRRPERRSWPPRAASSRPSLTLPSTAIIVEVDHDNGLTSRYAHLSAQPR